MLAVPSAALLPAPSVGGGLAAPPPLRLEAPPPAPELPVTSRSLTVDITSETWSCPSKRRTELSKVSKLETT